jgi:hypothetical protein
MPNRAQRRAILRAFGNLLKDDKLISSLPSSSPASMNNDPIIAEYIAFRQAHPNDPLPQSLLDRANATFPGVDLGRIGKNIVRDMLSGQPDDGRQ